MVVSLILRILHFFVTHDCCNRTASNLMTQYFYIAIRVMQLNTLTLEISLCNLPLLLVVFLLLYWCHCWLGCFNMKVKTIYMMRKLRKPTNRWTWAKTFCGVDNFPGRWFNLGVIYITCESDIHMECFLTVRKLKEYLEGCHDDFLCSDICCLRHGNEHSLCNHLQKDDALLRCWCIETAAEALVTKSSPLSLSEVESKYFWCTKCRAFCQEKVYIWHSQKLNEPTQVRHRLRQHWFLREFYVWVPYNNKWNEICSSTTNSHM